jgi:T-complex protein 1 subunit alpha
VKVDSLGRQSLVNAAMTSLSSKVLFTDALLFSNMAVDALSRVKTGSGKYPLKSVNILKAHGKSAKESQFIEGFALNCTVASQAMPKRIVKAKIACIDFNLNKARLGQGISITVTDPKKLEEIRLRESDIAKERINLILNAGANVVLTSKGIDDLSLKYFVEKGAMGVRRVRKEDLKRIAKATGATLILNLANLEGEESFDASYLGDAEEVAQERVADEELLVIRGTKKTCTSSIILRGANTTLLDEMDRCMRDALSVVKRTLESGSVVAGGGAVEADLNIYLEDFASTLGSREQLAVAEFARALLVIPKTLALNAAMDAPDLTAKLCAYHNAGQQKKAENDKEKKRAQYRYFGLDLLGTQGVRNNKEAGVLEPSMSKVKSFQFATEAAITILRIDDLIKLNPKKPAPGEEY